MLQSVRIQPVKEVQGRFAIVAAKYNRRYVDSLVRGAKQELEAVDGVDVNVVRVPGSFEIPVVASRLAHQSDPPWAGILCFGAIFQGETSHAQHIAEAVSHALAHLQMQTGVPVIHGVGLFATVDQAKARCLNWERNRGRESAHTALEMARVMAGIDRFDRRPATKKRGASA